jgi:TrmH family RNA methyltransferase
MKNLETQPLSVSRQKLYASLAKKKYRARHKLFLAEGERTVTQLLESGNPDTEAVVIVESITLPGKIASCCASRKIPVFTASPDRFLQLADTRTPQGILAVCRIPGLVPLSYFRGVQGDVLLALDDLSDPGNLGTMYRTAAWFGAGGLIISPETADLYNPKVVRSTAGATGSLPVAEAPMEEALSRLSAAGYRILLLDLAPEAITLQKAAAENENRPVVLVAGNEARGISEGLKAVYPKVYIPGSSDRVESLNAAVSTAIALHAFRQTFFG